MNNLENNDTNSIDHNRISLVNDLMHRLWDAKVIITLGLSALILRACYYNSPEIAIPSTMVAASEIAYNNVNDVIGKTVTIRSEAIQKVGLSSFTVSDKQFLQGESTIVINASGVPFDLPADKNTKIQVVGQVRNLVIPEIERDFNLKLQDASLKDHINRPAIIARSIALAPEVSEVIDNPTKYYGKKLAIMGKVQKIQSPVLFTVDENHLMDRKELVVLLKATPKAAINQGELVAMMGVVRPFVVADVEREYNVTWDQRVKKQMQAEYGNKPVLIANVVYP